MNQCQGTHLHRCFEERYLLTGKLPRAQRQGKHCLSQRSPFCFSECPYDVSHESESFLTSGCLMSVACGIGIRGRKLAGQVPLRLRSDEAFPDTPPLGASESVQSSDRLRRPCRSGRSQARSGGRHLLCGFTPGPKNPSVRVVRPRRNRCTDGQDETSRPLSDGPRRKAA